MTTRRRSTVKAALWAVAALGFAWGCSGDQAPARGQVMVAFDTDMTVPRDISRVQIQVLVSGRLVFSETYEVGAEGKAKLPATLALVGPEGRTSAPVMVKVVGLHDTQARTLRRVVTQVPRDRIALLPMKIEWLCDGSVRPVASGPQQDWESTCANPGESCEAGGCVADEVAVEALPAYSAPAVFGGGETPAEGTCFDTVACFAGAARVTPRASDCSVDAVEVGTGKAGLSFAMVRPPGTEGICGPESCFVPLDAESRGGWRRDEASGRIVFPAAVCERLSTGAILGVAMTTSCATKMSGVPVCGDWSAVPRSPDAPETGAGGAGSTGGSGGGGGGTGVEGQSCAWLEPRCGAAKDEDCCTSLVVPGGTFYRSYDQVTYTDQSAPATVSAFRLDKFEVTVGRFRAFKAAWEAGWRPAAGAGKHTHLNDGQGLTVPGVGSFEPGWDPAWESSVAPTDANLACDDLLQAWTPAPSEGEERPIACANWYELAAFCIWDGGFLPSEAEWNFAASGGDEQRVFPWSAPPAAAAIDCSRASYDCGNNTCGDGAEGCGPGDLIEVGTRPGGDGRWGHAELAGNVREWVLDTYAAQYREGACIDCAATQGAVDRGFRGGLFANDETLLRTAAREGGAPGYRANLVGGRCARGPASP